jgi:hypothetical protein
MLYMSKREVTMAMQIRTGFIQSKTFGKKIYPNGMKIRSRLILIRGRVNGKLSNGTVNYAAVLCDRPPALFLFSDSRLHTD